MLVLFSQHNLRQAPLDTQVGAIAQYTEIPEQTIRDIIYCESGFNPTAVNKNKNGSTDHSLFQINSIHKKEMSGVGLDIKDPTDNLIYGAYLMSKDGLKHWNSSKACWAKQSIVKANIDT